MKGEMVRRELLLPHSMASRPLRHCSVDAPQVSPESKVARFHIDEWAARARQSSLQRQGKAVERSAAAEAIT